MANLINPIDWVVTFSLCIYILINSKKRFGKLNWEWSIMSFLMMSTWIVLIKEIIFKEDSFATRAWVFAGAVGIYELFKRIEHPVNDLGIRWQFVRRLSAILGLLTIIYSIFYKIMSYYFLTGIGYPLIGIGSIISLLGFIVGQAGMYINRVKEP